MSDLFKVSRRDGRSNAQVLLDYVSGANPGRVYPYEELGEVLAVGTSRSFDVAAIRGVVRTALPRLLKEQQRALHNVVRVGYRLALANEHTKLAHTRQRRADNQLKMGLKILRNVRWEEMTENERQAHEGTLMVTEALYANQVALEKRQRTVEEAIAGLSKRVDVIANG